MVIALDQIFTQKLECLGEFELETYPIEYVKQAGFAFTLERKRVYHTDIPDEIKKDWGTFLAEGGEQMVFDRGRTVIKVANSPHYSTFKGCNKFWKDLEIKNTKIPTFLPVVLLGYLKVYIKDANEWNYLLVQEQLKVEMVNPSEEEIEQFYNSIGWKTLYQDGSVGFDIGEDFIVTDLKSKNVTRILDPYSTDDFLCTTSLCIVDCIIAEKEDSSK